MHAPFSFPAHAWSTALPRALRAPALDRLRRAMRALALPRALRAPAALRAGARTLGVALGPFAPALQSNILLVLRSALWAAPVLLKLAALCEPLRRLPPPAVAAVLLVEVLARARAGRAWISKWQTLLLACNKIV